MTTSSIEVKQQIEKDAAQQIGSTSIENPIFAAVRNKDYKTIEEYFLSGRELKIIDANGNSLFSKVYFSEDRKIIELFLNHPKIPPIFKATFNWDVRTISEYHNKGGDFYLDISNIVLPKTTEKYPMKFLLGALAFIMFAINLEFKKGSQEDDESMRNSFDEIIRIFIKANYDFKSYHENRKVLRFKSGNPLFIESSLDDSRAQEGGKFLLFESIRKKALRGVLMAITCIPSLEVINSNGNTPIIEAIKYEQHDILKLLILSGANLHKPINTLFDIGQYGKASPLIIACNFHDLTSIQIILEAGADVNEQDSYGSTPLLCTVKHETSETLNILGLLLSHKDLKPEITNHNCVDAFHLAIKLGHSKIVKKLIESGKFDLNKREKVTKDESTPLLLAIAAKNLEIFRLLLAHGADCTVPSLNGTTPLMQAALQGSMEMVKILVLEKGIDVNQNNKFFVCTALAFAAKGGNVEILRFLFENKAVPTLNKEGGSLLHYAAVSQNPQIITELLDPKYGMDINAVANNDTTALITAVIENKPENVKVLLKHEADFGTLHKLKPINPEDNTTYATPLMMAQCFKFKECENLLLAALLNKCFKKLEGLDLFKKTLKKLMLELLMKSELKYDTDHTIYLKANSKAFSYQMPRNKEIVVELTVSRLKEISERLLKSKDPSEINLEKIKIMIMEGSKAYQELLVDLEFKKNVEQTQALKNLLKNLEMRFYKNTTTYPGIHYHVKKLVTAQEEYVADCIRWDEVSKEKAKQALEANRNSLKRDRTKSKSYQESLELNQKRISDAKALKKDLERFLVSEKDIISSFYQDFEDKFIQIEEWCNEFDFENATKAIAMLEEHEKAYENLTKRITLFGADLESRHEMLLEKFKKDEKERTRDRREQEKAASRLQSETKALDEEAKRNSEAVALEKRRLELQKKENDARRLRFRSKRLAYLAEKEAKQKAEEESKLKAEQEAKRQAQQETTVAEEQVTSPKSKHQEKQNAETETLLFSPLLRQRVLKPLTLDIKGSIALELKQKELQTDIKMEIEILEECIKACIEMNISTKEDKKNSKENILKIIKLQRHALLGTLARCMEYLKQMKNDETFSALQARKLRNYLFKGKRFLMKKEKDFKAEMELNHEIIHMVNEIIFCLRAKEPDFSKIKSRLYHELEKEVDSEALWIPAVAGMTPGGQTPLSKSPNKVSEKPSRKDSDKVSDKPLDKDSDKSTDLIIGKPWLSACKNGVKRANAALEYYKTCKDQNGLLIICAEKYLLAARGTFAMWIRDYYSKYYRQSPEYKELLDFYIEEGNKIRHNDSSPLRKEPSL